MASALPVAMFGLPGGSEWIVILLVALLLFGRRLPDVARSMGRSIVEFKRGLHEVKQEIDQASDEDSPAKPSPSSLPRKEDQDSGA